MTFDQKDSFVIPAQAGIQPCRCRNLSGKRFLEILRSGFPLSWE
ncbi:PilS cassette [Neisseria meningitidis serogroup B]|uniref:PilS cassette n=1 Tax=Neisseria meningitidis serogroup B TaxID=491 RepID=A0A0H5DMT4_NEIMI|nr:PilS cassette [Neisseria meningitidis serogroup B]